MGLTKEQKAKQARKGKGRREGKRRGAGPGHAAAERVAASKAAGSFVSVADRKKMKHANDAAKRKERRSVSPPNPQEAKREAKEAKRAAAAAAAPALDRSKPNELRQVSRNAAAVANVERALGPAQFAQALEHRKRTNASPSW